MARIFTIFVMGSFQVALNRAVPGFTKTVRSITIIQQALSAGFVTIILKKTSILQTASSELHSYSVLFFDHNLDLCDYM